MIDIARTQADAHTLDALAHRAPKTADLRELATWLQVNGAAHLSAIERIELAERLVTRRRFLIGAGALALVLDHTGLIGYSFFHTTLVE